MSRQIFYATDFAAMNSLIGYLTEECCSADGASCAPAFTPAEAKRNPLSRRRRA
jgi:hypothetical protein